MAKSKRLRCPRAVNGRAEITRRNGEEACTPRASSSPAKPHALPADGAELERRLTDYDARLAEQGLCMRGDLLQHVVGSVSKAGFGTDMIKWPEQAIVRAAEETKAFEQAARTKEERKRAAEQRLTAPRKTKNP